MNGCSILRSGFVASSPLAVTLWLLPPGVITACPSSENESPSDNTTPLDEAVVGDDEFDEDGTRSPGANTISVLIEEESNGYQTTHLIRGQGETDLDLVNRWLHSCRKNGLSPPPAAFLGGSSAHMESPYGDVAYVTVKDLEPAPSAWAV